MLKNLVLIVLLFMSIGAFGQNKKPHKRIKFKYKTAHLPTSPHDDCVFTNKYTLQQRLQKYPFNKAVKIVAVGYQNAAGRPSEAVIIYNESDTTKIDDTRSADTLEYGLNIKNGIADTTSFRVQQMLTRKYIEKLTQIIYNTDYRIKGDNGVWPGANCYEPRNALLFYDSKGKIFDYLEICFACDRYESQSGNLNIGFGCYQKMDLMKKWFVNLGIKYGTIEK